MFNNDNNECRDIISITGTIFKVLSKKIQEIFTLFVNNVTPWVVTSVITSFGVNIE